MGIGKTDNYRFYDGFEGEEEIMFSVNSESMETLHIWDGYFSDIFGNPPLDGKGWHGFTRDYNQCEGAFDDYEETSITNLQEYIDDLKNYKNKEFRFEETKEVYELIYAWLIDAQEKCGEIKVTVW